MERLAILIDADNASMHNISNIFNKVEKYGNPIIKRIYGDWGNSCLRNWQDSILNFALTPIQQFSYTKGKNATDMLLTIDAIELLYDPQHKLDGFCIVSSDSDFTPLVLKIRSKGLKVYGFGRTNCSEAFKKACDIFTYVDVAEGVEACFTTQSDKPQVATSTETPPQPQEKKITLNVIKTVKLAINDCVLDEYGWVNLGILTQKIKQHDPNFNPKRYGYSKMSDFIFALDLFQVRKKNTTIYVNPLRGARKYG
ncbi:NYN domain-containing protein [Acinetobacter sp. P1(2025)]|uniref:NYN domain-containing protein n=1 Tax=Acinetobacter sp. P1(2025) TaxID=3446120 RepID=UPI003F529CE1